MGLDPCSFYLKMEDIFNKCNSQRSNQMRNVLGEETGTYEPAAALRGRPGTHVTVLLLRGWLGLRTRP